MFDCMCIEIVLSEKRFEKERALEFVIFFSHKPLKRAFRHVTVTQELVIKEADTHTWVLKSWVGSLGASSMILSMLDTYLEDVS